MATRAKARSLLGWLDLLPSWLSVFLGLGLGSGVGVLLLGTAEPRSAYFLEFAAAIGIFGLLAWSGEPVLVSTAPDGDSEGEAGNGPLET